MAKIFSSLAALISRLLKVIMVTLLLPFSIALWRGVVEQLEVVTLSRGTARLWVERGLWSYLGIHVLLYRPEALFRVGRQLFSSMAVWLFGGQVASVERMPKSQGGDGGKATSAKGRSEGQRGHGSTLVAFSPYVVPLFTVLVCVAGLVLRQWWDRPGVDAAVCFAIGLTITFHWLMTADELQAQRGQWPLETYLLALGLIFVLTLIVAGACVPWALPEFSLSSAFTEALSQTQRSYITVIHRLFF